MQRLSRMLRHHYFQPTSTTRARIQIFGGVLLVVGVVVGMYVGISGIIHRALASDTTQSWDFSSGASYTTSTGTEINASTARLKVQNYIADSSTALLLHLDESSGNPTDSSSNANTATATSLTYGTGNLNNAITSDGIASKISVADSASVSLSQANTLEAWTKFSSAFSAGSHYQRQGIFDKGEYQLYFDNETGKLTYELADATSSNWTQAAGNEINGSWDLDGNPTIESSRVIGTDYYVGLGNGAGDADVWKWDGSTWTKIGGDGLNNSWAINTFESVLSMATDGTNLYVGLGLTAGDAEVWKWNGSTWTKVGGDALNSSWQINTFEGVYSLYYQGTTLYAGLGSGASDAEVWSCANCATSPSWTKIGGDSTNSGWTTNYDIAYSITGDGTNIYAGLGITAGEAEIWRWNGSSWTKVGGDAVGSSWDGTNFEDVFSLTYVGGKLYAGLGITAGDADVWQCTSCDGTPSWTQVGGDTLNSSWAASTYEGVYALTNDGTNVYAGLGSTAGDNEVWQYNGSTWSKIGGDAVDSSFTNTHTIVNTLQYGNSTLYAGLISASTTYAGQVWTYKTTDSPKWTQIGGNYVNFSWGFRGLNDIEVLNVSGDYLYAGGGYAAVGNALVWRYDGTSWQLIGGQGVNSSWAINTYESVTTMISYKGNLYVGLGTTANDAEVWKWNGSTWTQVGGDSLKSSWGAGFEQVNTLAEDNGYLYAGLGNSANDAEIWRYSDSSDTWVKVGGDSLYTGWTTNYEQVLSIQPFNGKLYAGLGNSNGDAEVWQCTSCDTGTPSWSKVGGDGTNSSWNTSPVNSYNDTDILLVYNGTLIAGLGTESGEASMWSYDPNSTTWSQFGGDDVNSSWAAATYERIRTAVVYNGDLYAGLGNSTGDGEVWKWNGSTWTQVAGDSLNSGWANTVEEINSFSVYKGKLYAGLGNTVNADAAVWSYGNNAILQSTTASFNTSWHHVAATYDGTTMKLYIDGVLDNSLAVSRSLPDTAHELLLSTTYAGRERGKPDGHFEGALDEVRVSSTARSSFTTSPYSISAETVQPTTAVYTSQIKSFDAFTTNETANGGQVGYRLSNDNGATWKYYSSGWVTSSSTAQTSPAATINSHIATFPVTSSGILWQAVLMGNGNQQVTLNSVDIGAIQDITAPTNPSSLTALSASAGSAITTDTWYTHTAPYFSWTGADDGSGAGIAGYYVYFGSDNTADPVTAGSFQSASTYTASGLSSGTTYYLRVKAKDNAGNTSSSTWSAFTYKFDNGAPSAPSSVTVSPSGYASTNAFTFNWSSVTDTGAGIAGYQYKTATSSGSLSNWSTTTSSITVSPDSPAYQTGENIFYVRSVDNAGNISASPTQISFYFGGDGPSTPQLLNVSPSSNTTNSFAFSWSAPETYSGTSASLTYCYTVNTLPTDTTCTFTSAGATSLAASSFATQQGLNTFYVVARNGSDYGSSINYGNYASVTFTANTSAPGIPLNADIADVSVKSTESWKLAVSWEAPSDTGSGVANYEIYRSTDDTTYTKVASTTGIAYVDTGLDQVAYYYKIRACDNVNNCGAYTTAVTATPTGKYTTAAGVSSGPTVTGVTTKQATISWSTDRASDSKVQYGTSAGSYNTSEPSNSKQVSDHSIVLTNLSPGTTYYYKAKWTDEDGNTGVSAEKTFSTDPAPTISEVSVKNISLASGFVSFTSNGASKVKIYYGETSAFGFVKTVETSTAESNYTAELDDLKDGTKYYYKINAFDSEDAEYEGTILSFETLPRPKISTVRIQQVKGTAQPTILVSWVTNTETSSIATYYPEGAASQARDEVNVNLQKGEHRLLIRGLQAETPYTLIVKGRDKAGNEASSEPQRLTTATDTRPPQISGLKVEGNVQVSQNNAQGVASLVVSWTTDEPGTSQVEYAEGTGTTYSQKTQEDSNLALNHVIIITGLAPSKVYHLRALSKDKASNLSQSVDTVSITPKATDNALNLVISNLQQVFGFLGALQQ